ncbi:DgyrCDS12815 [Dimorphilus gyrociliatus]|uniref:DgyrCDS12815 n=1 Tax=Dimorphilus gyrociliatus TaxID=2664684 RepID=A0A7I8W8U4_9ANNE|nr:DgyrCDS12815 [Dimorphilus gyrociliatus]
MTDPFDDGLDDSYFQDVQLEFEEEKKDLTDSKIKLPVPETFPFPFPPYDIQVGFMKNVYECLENRGIGIFESPTGTGKSLSIACSALKWLIDNEERQKKDLDNLLSDNNEEESGGDWIKQHEIKKKKEDDAYELKKIIENRETLDARLKDLKKTLKEALELRKKTDKLDQEFRQIYKDQNVPDFKKMNENFEPLDNDDNDEDNLLVDDYDSDENDKKGNRCSDDENEEDLVTKILYCSRTHTQLSQFVHEVKKTDFSENSRVISLGSRQNFCINPSVRKLESLTLINDRCLELQKNKTKKKSSETPPKKRRKSEKIEKSCPYNKKENIRFYKDRALIEIQDIEDLTQQGKSIKACPYYGLRAAIPDAQLICLPYNTLLHKPTREKSGIKLKGNIVIIDEAHNLFETISSVYSVQIFGSQLIQAHSQLQQYHDKYRSRLKAKNLLYIKQLITILSCLIKALGGKAGINADSQSVGIDSRLETLNDFLFKNQLDHMNFFKIKKYCENSQISRKLHGFIENSLNEDENDKSENTKGVTSFLKTISKPKVTKNDIEENENLSVEEKQLKRSSPLMIIESFIETLTTADVDGRILISKQNLLSKSWIKFVLLNPALYIKDILEEARAVIVAGGTMQPFSEFKDRLFYAAGATSNRIIEYTCDHVIPPENIHPMALARGAGGIQLDFSYDSRRNFQILDELGKVVCNVCNIVPAGVVLFFPSYDFERIVTNRWNETDIIKKIEIKKRIFREPQKSSMVEKTLNEYKTCIDKNYRNFTGVNGAIIFSVVGGKLSEGINFSDNLGRCVIMIGLPYPNKKSVELQEKMNYLNQNMPKSSDGRLPGQVLYENLCMKAVNQSIGRAIRHKNDYASILLLDHRYLRPSIKSKLPKWIAKELKEHEKFGPAFASLNNFFREKSKLKSY